MSRPPGRAPRPPLTRATLYRTAVPIALVALAAVTVVLAVLAVGILVGVIPYPGK